MFSPAEKNGAASRAVAIWLLWCCLAVAWMVWLGGWTRLTESGLSMTDWRPVTGILPPLNGAQWQEAFDAYRQSPQYSNINAGMSLDAFKTIFWPEYLHRLSGRIVGLLFFLPFALFLVKRILPAGVRTPLLLAAGAGCIQGGVGWWMVKSGLSDAPYVSHYRLAFHLGTAFVIFFLLYLARLRAVLPYPENAKPAARTGAARYWFPALTALFILQVILGAFVAGKDAGHAFSDFPLMNGHIIPPGTVSPLRAPSAAFSDPVTLHVMHRLSGYLLWCAALCAAAHLFLCSSVLKYRFAIFAGLLTCQVALGAATALSGVAIIPASAHQVFALVMFAFWIKTGYIPYTRDTDGR